MKILVLTGSYQDNLEKAIKERGHEAEFVNPKEFNLVISENAGGYDQIYKGSERITRGRYDCVISRIGSNREFATKVLDHFKRHLDVFCVQTGDAINICSDKFRTAQIMSENGIRVPKQIYADTPEHAQFLVKKLGGLPLILKELSGSKGKGLILLESARQTNMTLESYYSSGRKIILQQYIENGGKDERHIVVNGDVVSSMERQSPKDDIRANLSLSGTGRAIEADPETKEICIKAVAAIPGLNFAGVDIMKDNAGTPYLIEINSNPGELIVDITGHNHFLDLVKYCENNYKKGGKTDNTTPHHNAAAVAGMGEPVPGLPSKMKKETFADWETRCKKAGFDFEAATANTSGFVKFYRDLYDETGECYTIGV